MNLHTYQLNSSPTFQLTSSPKISTDLLFNSPTLQLTYSLTLLLSNSPTRLLTNSQLPAGLHLACLFPCKIKTFSGPSSLDSIGALPLDPPEFTTRSSFTLNMQGHRISAINFARSWKNRQISRGQKTMRI